MAIDSPFDPRAALVRTKYFNQYPKPLERWLWQQGLPQAAERVFWLHWSEGRRNGDWCSEIPLKRVALECCVDPSTVTRSYQVLKAKGLLRREDPGRDPNNPFCQATAITEVRLPREFLTELSRSPNRPQREAGGPAVPTIAAPANPLEPESSAGASLAAATIAAPISPAPEPKVSRQDREASKAMWGRASEAEQQRFYLASRDRLTHMEFDPDTRLNGQDRGQILAQLGQLAAARPTPAAPRVPAAVPGTGLKPRRLTLLDLARTRKRILDAVPAEAAPETLRQVMWAIEHGALRRFDPALAINIALKKIREGAWSRPHRMPPQWMPAGQTGTAKLPEQCSAA